MKLATLTFCTAMIAVWITYGITTSAVVVEAEDEDYSVYNPVAYTKTLNEIFALLEKRDSVAHLAIVNYACWVLRLKPISVSFSGPANNLRQLMQISADVLRNNINKMKTIGARCDRKTNMDFSQQIISYQTLHKFIGSQTAVPADNNKTAKVASKDLTIDRELLVQFSSMLETQPDLLGLRKAHGYKLPNSTQDFSYDYYMILLYVDKAMKSLGTAEHCNIHTGQLTSRHIAEMEYITNMVDQLTTSKYMFDIHLEELHASLGKYRNELKKLATHLVTHKCPIADMNPNTLMVYMIHFRDEIDDFLCSDTHTVSDTASTKTVSLVEKLNELLHIMGAKEEFHSLKAILLEEKPRLEKHIKALIAAVNLNHVGHENTLPADVLQRINKDLQDLSRLGMNCARAQSILTTCTSMILNTQLLYVGQSALQEGNNDVLRKSIIGNLMVKGPELLKQIGQFSRQSFAYGKNNCENHSTQLTKALTDFQNNEGLYGLFEQLLNREGVDKFEPQLSKLFEIYGTYRTISPKPHVHTFEMKIAADNEKQENPNENDSPIPMDDRWKDRRLPASDDEFLYDMESVQQYLKIFSKAVDSDLTALTSNKTAPMKIYRKHIIQFESLVTFEKQLRTTRYSNIPDYRVYHIKVENCQIRVKTLLEKRGEHWEQNDRTNSRINVARFEMFMLQQRIEVNEYMRSVLQNSVSTGIQIERLHRAREDLKRTKEYDPSIINSDFEWMRVHIRAKLKQYVQNRSAIIVRLFESFEVNTQAIADGSAFQGTGFISVLYRHIKSKLVVYSNRTDCKGLAGYVHTVGMTIDDLTNIIYYIGAMDLNFTEKKLSGFKYLLEHVSKLSAIDQAKRQILDTKCTGQKDGNLIDNKLTQVVEAYLVKVAPKL